VTWEHIEKLYYDDSGFQSSTPGLSMVPKLKYEHVFLSSFSKMRVDLAAQVLQFPFTINFEHCVLGFE
jgi:hypothetical protein